VTTACRVPGARSSSVRAGWSTPLALSGRVEDARERFEALLEYVSPLGLLAEEVDPETGGHLGNYPQAFSHIGLINSALYVGFAEGGSCPARTRWRSPR